MGMLKLNTDGSLQNNVGSWGAVFRNHEGRVVKLAPGHCLFMSIDEIELDVVHQGLKIAVRHRYSKV